MKKNDYQEFLKSKQKTFIESGFWNGKGNISKFNLFH